MSARDKRMHTTISRSQINLIPRSVVPSPLARRVDPVSRWDDRSLNPRVRLVLLEMFVSRMRRLSLFVKECRKRAVD